jgi:replicative DNA helicase
MLERDALGLALERVGPADFYRREHQLIFAAMLALYDQDQAIDTVTVAEQLERAGRLEQAGGREYLADLLATVATAANAGYHAGIVKEKAVLRGLIREATAIAAEAYDAALPAGEILDQAQTRIFNIAESTKKGGFEPVKAVVPSAFRTIEEAFRNKSDVTGLRTHYADFDRATAGLQKGDLLVLAARPSMGKTAFALNIAFNVATRENTPVAIFSLEMAKEQLVMRMLCASGGFNNHDIRRGQIQPQDWPRLTAACEKLAAAPIYIDDSSGLSVLEMKAKARLLKRQHDIGLLVVDYLQLMTGGTRAENRQQEISDISRNLKALAKDLNVPVLALSQLSRAVESRGDNKPKLSDLRESGAIEQDADVVLFIYREEVYRPDDESVRNMATIIIGNQRNGPTGQFDLHFNRNCTRFDNLQR